VDKDKVKCTVNKIQEKFIPEQAMKAQRRE
jgi:hypothetical protein